MDFIWQQFTLEVPLTIFDNLALLTLDEYVNICPMTGSLQPGEECVETDSMRQNSS